MVKLEQDKCDQQLQLPHWTIGLLSFIDTPQQHLTDLDSGEEAPDLATVLTATTDGSFAAESDKDTLFLAETEEGVPFFAASFCSAADRFCSALVAMLETITWPGLHPVARFLQSAVSTGSR